MQKLHKWQKNEKNFVCWQQLFLWAGLTIQYCTHNSQHSHVSFAFATVPFVIFPISIALHWVTPARQKCGKSPMSRHQELSVKRTIVKPLTPTTFKTTATLLTSLSS